MAGIFNVDFRKLFSQAQPPRKRFPQTLDLGESLLTTLNTDSETLDALDDTLQIEKKYSGIKMVMEASLNEFFAQATFKVETVIKTFFLSFWFTELEGEAISLYKEISNKPAYLYNESEFIPEEASIIVSVPATLFTNNFAQVDTQVKKLKVAGKSYKLVTL